MDCEQLYSEGRLSCSLEPLCRGRDADDVYQRLAVWRAGLPGEPADFPAGEPALIFLDTRYLTLSFKPDEGSKPMRGGAHFPPGRVAFLAELDVLLERQGPPTLITSFGEPVSFFDSMRITPNSAQMIDRPPLAPMQTRALISHKIEFEAEPGGIYKVLLDFSSPEESGTASYSIRVVDFASAEPVYESLGNAAD